MLIQVFEQGGFLAEYRTEENFFKSVKENPAKHHEFTAVRQRLVRMKIESPNMRFRLEKLGCTREKVKTSSTAESGIEMPEEYFVELSKWEEENGKADASDVVVEEVGGVLTQGVPCPVKPSFSGTVAVVVVIIFFGSWR